MKKNFQSEVFSIGLAMFSMFFGAGNIIFPLAIGQISGDQNIFAVLGLLITGVFMPFAGVLAMILFEGDYRSFFGRLGRVPGYIVALLIITLLGPLGSTPRCIALAYSTLQNAFPSLSTAWFSLIACTVIYLFTFRKSRILSLLGWILTPLLLIALGAVICIGLFTSSDFTTFTHPSRTSMFIHGIQEGYNTMDLLAAFFFSSTIISLLQVRSTEKKSAKHYLRLSLGAGGIGAALLGIVYFAFSFLANSHGSGIEVNKEELLSAIIFKLVGPSAAMLVSCTIALACLTTAIALILAFCDFMEKEVFRKKVSYQVILIASLILTFFVSTLRFNGISAFLSPILQVCYPGLILLTLVNLTHKFRSGLLSNLYRMS